MLLTIRESQMKTLRLSVERRFKAKLRRHAMMYFPETAAELGDDLPEAIIHAVKRARQYGFDGEREICRYLNLEFRFGRNYDADPNCQWARDLLRSSLPGPPRMQQLYELAVRHEPAARGYFAQLRSSNE